MKTHWHRKNADRGFTLVELLIVIVIIAILAGLLFPAITAAVEAAQSIECRNNLKEIAQAVLRYANENGGVIVPAHDAGVDLRWANILVMRGYVKATNLVAKPNEDPLEKRSILLCPSTLPVKNAMSTNPVSPFDDKAQGWYEMGMATHKVACSYYWNGCTDIGLTYWRQFPSLYMAGNDPNKKQYLHYLTEIQQRTRTVMAMDGLSINAQIQGTQGTRGRIAARHRGKYGKRSRTNIVFYDGHAEEYEWTLDYTKTPPWKDDLLWATPELRATSNLIFRLDDQNYAPP